MQYTKDVRSTLDYLVERGFFLYIHWLNPRYSDPGECRDRLGLVNEILSVPSILSIRDGRIDPAARVQEMREFIFGWASYRNLLFNC